MPLLPWRTFRPYLEWLEDRCTPATFTVTSLSDVVDPLDGKRTLREAIDKANTRAGSDVIAFKAGLEGTIKLTGGEIVIDDSLVVQGPGANKLAVSGQLSSRIFNISDASAMLSVTIKGLEFRKGLASGRGGAIVCLENLKLVSTVFTLNHSDLSGGAIDCIGNLTVKKSTISGNTAAISGGGISCTTATITDSTIAGNAAEAHGGGILGDTVSLTASTLSGNVATSRGGGLYCSESATIASSSITGNWSGGDGGGIQSRHTSIDVSTVRGNTAVGKGGAISGLASDSDAIITDCTITANTAGTFGGGISGYAVGIVRSTVAGNAAALNGGGVAGTFAFLDRSSISGNSAGGNGGGISCGQAVFRDSTLAANRAGTDGGGLYVSSSSGADPMISNCTISGNRAGGNGGGICSSKFNLELVNSTIAFNRAEGRGGGIFVDNVHTLESCLIADNESVFSSDDDIDNGPSGTFAFKNCLIGVEVSVPYTDNGGNLVGTAANPIDPRLAPLASNGGKTQTHALKKGSPAINAGSNPEGLTKDQRGGLFKRNVGGGVDIGAFERQ